MDFKADFRLLLLVGVGVVAASWAFANTGNIQALTTTGTNGYVSMVRGLEAPSSGGVVGGAGNFAGNTGLAGGSYYTSPNYQAN